MSARSLRSCDWTPDMDRALLTCEVVPHTERYAGGGEITELARKLGKTPSACRDRLGKLLGPRGLWTREGLWTAEEDNLIAGRMWDDRPGWIDVAVELGRTYGAVCNRACQLRKRARADAGAA